MTSTTSAHPGLSAPNKHTSLSGIPGSNAAHLLERSRAGLRGGTPDSEALASSDDEQEQFHRLQKVTSNPAPKPARRASWLTEAQQSISRNNSITGAGPFSPVSPKTMLSSTDHGPWGATTAANPPSRGAAGTTSFPWANTIWNTDSSKGPPQRLTEVMPSPTTLVPPGSAGFYAEDKLVSPREATTDQAIPFAIPLQPTPKTYRSQSYSVGQLDPETAKPPPAALGGAGPYSRPRVGSSYAGLQHRPSRPSMLGDFSHDSQLLGQLREVEDDEDGTELSDPGYLRSSEQARTIEQLTRENAMLRQAAAESRERNAGTMTTNSPQRSAGGVRLPGSSRDTVSSEGSETIPYDEDERDVRRGQTHDNGTGRRFTEYGPKTGTHHAFGGYNEHRSNIDGVKRGQWQSSLGFGGVGEPPQSRRHSFAEVPTRQNSIEAGDEARRARDSMDYGSPTSGKPLRPDGLAENAPPHDGVSYFARIDPNIRGLNNENRPPSSGALHQKYVQGQYGPTQQFAGPHHRHKQLLYIVTFKCQRADVFYVQEGTGLQVHQGDLVIVEADRGTDLGTVASENVPWAEAKDLKDKLLVEHHKWLMMFSPHAQQGGMTGQNPNGPQQGNAQGAGPGHGHGQQPGIHDVPSGELKPKMIKRVAQQHEIQSLREKEGAEAKAKRTCQQKVVEHRLRMEILDAEFQMDWKKLTFFYFADSYINFNPLVTDLFKIYKTRIWMSAINTAAIAAPIANQHMLSGPNSRNFGAENDEYAARHHQQRRPQDSASVGSMPVAYPTNEPMWNQTHDFGTMPPPSAMPPMYGQPAFDMRHMQQMPQMAQYGQPSGAMPPYFNLGEYTNSKALAYPARPERASNPRERADQGGDWNQSFQKLSLDR